MPKNDKTLVIVESPTKAKTINKYLGNDYEITSSMGHLIDLPKSRLAVDVDNGFSPEYITIRGKAKVLNELKRKAGSAGRVLLATDPDREGEAIAWHLNNALKQRNDDIQRIVFNEITQDAIKDAVNNPRKIDEDLVNAQQARRILDRIVGYNISPILWKKVKKGLSAGRVQSVALRVICEREKEIDEFIPEEYWSLDALFKVKKKEFTASFITIDGEKKTLRSQDEVDTVIDRVKGRDFIINSLQKKERKRKAPAPYITSKLQQDAANRLGFTSGKTMMVAQQLYEGVNITGEGPVGLITYMRTDSTRVSPGALTMAREYIGSNFSSEYLPEKPNFYTNKKGAQDAHEAIRPTGVMRTPESIKADLTRDQFRLYQLIWKRFVSSQMTPERSEIVTAILECNGVEFRASGSTVLFKGFTALYKDDKSKRQILPELSEGDVLRPENFNPEQHFTTPPPRYNDASLVKFLEESGIGRPSTYAPTINTLIKRYYVVRHGRQLVPTVLGKLVNSLIVEYFSDLVSIDFTATMEENLDQVEEAKSDWKNMLQEFYTPFKATIDHAEHAMEEMKGILDEETDLVCEKCGRPMVKKLGRYGFFLACSGFPECRNSKSLPLGKCPREDCDGDVVKRSSKKGRPFYACSNYPECEFISRDSPSDKPCPKCGKLLFIKKLGKRGEMLVCLNESCDYKLELLDESEKNDTNPQEMGEE
ncbi:MAG: type I DNA topoisomerase [Spirochaetota bacterium]